MTTADFSKRLHSACDAQPLVPPMHYGRLTWMRDAFAKEGVHVSMESVRKWFSGDAKPRPDKLALMARILEVDEAWLSLGISPDLQPRERKVRNATADGAVNLLAGLIQMDGGNPAFPERDDARAAEGAIDLYAVIKGAHYGFHVSLVDGAGPYCFRVPVNHGAAMQVGVIPGPDFTVRIVEIPEDAIRTGTRRGGVIEVDLAEADIERNRIRTFAKRL